MFRVASSLPRCQLLLTWLLPHQYCPLPCLFSHLKPRMVAPFVRAPIFPPRLPLRTCPFPCNVVDKLTSPICCCYLCLGSTLGLQLCLLWLVDVVRSLLWLTDSGCNFCSSHLTIALVSELAMMGALPLLLLWLHLF